MELISLAIQIMSIEPKIIPLITYASRAFEDFFLFLPALAGTSNDGVIFATLCFYEELLSYDGLEPHHIVDFYGKAAFFRKLEQIVVESDYSERLKDKVYQILFSLLCLADFKMICSFQKCADVLTLLLSFFLRPNQSARNIDIAATVTERVIGLELN